MKPKYYPHVTIAAAAGLILLPLCFVLSLPFLRAPAGGDFVTDNHTSPARQKPSGSDFRDRANSEQPDDPLSSAVVDNSATAEGGPMSSEPMPLTSPHTRVAMSAGSASRQADTPTNLGRVHSTASPEVHVSEAPGIRGADTGTFEHVTQRSPTSVEASGSMPPVALHSTDNLLDRAIMLSSETSEAPNEVPVPMSSGHAEEAEAGMLTAAVNSSTVADAVPEEPDFVISDQVTARPPSYFEATGHLAMSSEPESMIAGSAKSQSDRTNAPRESSSRKRSRSSSDRHSRAGRSDVTESSSGAVPPVASPNEWGLPGDGFGSRVQTELIDVILQQPLESRRVDRMENVVAVTRESGWPIALVRSDLPDDYWWVQQMVGMRGNAFAARVNFGNENSISGSVYHMVFVFLDSPDEVRRFRIAKQFKELPEGVRRSREYTFVRK